MSAAEILRAATDAGLTLTATDAGTLRVEPGEAVTPQMRAALLAVKPELLKLLRAKPATDWTRVRLADLRGVLEIEVPGVDVPVLLVSGCRRARELRLTQQGRAVVICTCTVMDMIVAGVSAEDAAAALQAAELIRGEVALKATA